MPVGSWACTKTADERRSIIGALVSLHKLGFIHGDARVSNIIKVEERHVWIGFMRGGSIPSKEAFPGVAQDDLKELIKSIYGEESMEKTSMQAYCESLHPIFPEPIFTALESLHEVSSIPPKSRTHSATWATSHPMVP
jgi:tRNA A-37 threonylcarbamoyl transferase component Bud32